MGEQSCIYIGDEGMQLQALGHHFNQIYGPTVTENMNPIEISS